MFNSTNRSFQSAAKSFIVSAVVIGFLGSGSTAMADHPVERSKQVTLTGLDLSTTQGQRIANERLHRMARTLCSQVVDELDLSHQTNFIACVDAAMSNANARLQALASRGAVPAVAYNSGK